MLPVILVTGFLGSGKTTFVRHLLRDAAARDLKVGLIINEWGVANIDGAILQESGGELVSEISGGCVCCSSQDEMIWTMIELGRAPREQQPDVVVLELSGLADPLVALDGLTVAALLPLIRIASMVSVLDSTRISDMQNADGRIAPLLVRQTALADLVIANKSDLAFRGEAGEGHKQETVEFLRELNPSGRLEFARGGAIDLDALWTRVLETDAALSAPHAGKAAHEHTQNLLIPLHKPFERATLEAALNELGPQVWRAKGFVKLVEEDGLFLAQYVGIGQGKWTLEKFDTSRLPKTPPTDLVFIGPDLNREALWRTFGGGATLLLA